MIMIHSILRRLCFGFDFPSLVIAVAIPVLLFTFGLVHPVLYLLPVVHVLLLVYMCSVESKPFPGHTFGPILSIIILTQVGLTIVSVLLLWYQSYYPY